MRTTKFIFTQLLLLVSLTSFSQLNSIKNLTWNHWYNYPNNFYELKWSSPDSSLSDTLIGYNIYRNGVLYRFYQDTIAQHKIPQDTSFGGEDFVYTYGGPFYIHITAVYNFNHIESLFDDSLYCFGAALGIYDTEKRITKAFPNPFSTQIMLQFNDELQNATITIYNAIGQKLKVINNITGRSVIIERENLPCGQFLLQLTQNDKIIYTDKIEIKD
mgnify:CR=1 FL=1